MIFHEREISKKPVANISKAKVMQGFAPKYFIREGLEHTAF